MSFYKSAVNFLRRAFNAGKQEEVFAVVAEEFSVLAEARSSVRLALSI